MSRRSIIMMNNKEENNYIDSIEVNEQLAISSCNFTSTRVVHGRTATLVIVPENVGVLHSAVVIDKLTNKPVDISASAIGVNGSLTCKFIVALPTGQRYFTAYLLDANGKRSQNGIIVSILCA